MSAQGTAAETEGALMEFASVKEAFRESTVRRNHAQITAMVTEFAPTGLANVTRISPGCPATRRHVPTTAQITDFAKMENAYVFLISQASTAVFLCAQTFAAIMENVFEVAIEIENNKLFYFSLI